MSAVCPRCGVAVVPGYVKCPKCHSELPAGSGRAKRVTAEPGGTALETRDFPIAPFVAALGVAAAIIIVFSVRSAGKKTDVTAAALPAPINAIAAPPAPLRPTSASPAAPQAAQGAAAALEDPRAAAAELETALRFQAPVGPGRDRRVPDRPPLGVVRRPGDAAADREQEGGAARRRLDPATLRGAEWRRCLRARPLTSRLRCIG